MAAVQPFYSLQGGATPQTRGEAQSFARKLLNTQTYRDSLTDRIKAKTLPPAVETMLWHYAFGKPIEQVNLTVLPGQEDLSGLTLVELQKRAAALAELLDEAKQLDDAIPAAFKAA